MQNVLCMLGETKYEGRQAERSHNLVFDDYWGETVINTWWNATVSSPKRDKQIKEL